MDNKCRADTPVTDKIRRQVGRVPHQTTHFRHVPYYDIFDSIQVIREHTSALVTRLALEFQIYTAVRHNSIRNAKRSEIDWENKVWIIPDEHMKMNKQHRVALNAGALAVLKKAFKLRIADSDLIFPSHEKGTVIDVSALSILCNKLNLAGTPHGFRGSFATWCADKGVPQELTEAALAHTPAAIVQAYTHTDYLERRKPLMDAWSDYIAGDLADDWRFREGDAAATHEANLELRRQFAESQRQFAEAQATIASMAATIASMAATMADMAADMALLKASKSTYGTNSETSIPTESP